MSGPHVGIVDYRMGNLRSVELALVHLGATPRWVHGPDDLQGLDAVVLPGVGAFARAMDELAALELVAPLQRWAERGRPLLGICLGFQLLFEASDEQGETAGLGLLPGRVTRLPDTAADGGRLKVPHMGWNTVRAVGQGPLTDFDGAWFYFVHSYAAPAEIGDRHGLVSEHGRPFAAAVVEGALWGCQFHPERSGRVGLDLLTRFLAALPPC
jgi:glutamine amidotransferase